MVKKLNKVAKALNKASKLHKKQSKIIKTHTHLKKIDEVQLIPNEINDGAYAALLG